MITSKTVKNTHVCTHEDTTATATKNKECLICHTASICVERGCWKERQGKANCNHCKERYCRKHWRALVDRI